MQTVYEYWSQGSLGKADRFILCSQSPRRKELLAFLEPQILSVEVDERAIEEEYMAAYAEDDFLTRAAKTCCQISMAKAIEPEEVGVVSIAADTIVVSDGKIHNKPLDLEESNSMFRSYFGKTHQVVTSVCLRSKTGIEVFYCVTHLSFVAYYPALEEAISEYVASGQALDKAGAYGIAQLDPRFIESIEGDWYNVIGLPVVQVSYRLFGKEGLR